MLQEAERLVDDVQSGRLSRREAVGRILALTGLALAGSARAQSGKGTQEKAPTFRSVGLNHIALRVTDIARSRAFYERHLGLSLLRESDSNCFLAAGKNHFVALFRGDRAGMDHYCYTVDGYEAGAVVEKLRAVGLEPERQENRVYFDDPDGLVVQVAAPYRGTR